MTGQPPEETERIYTGGQYGGYAEQGQQYQQDPFGASQYSGTNPFGEPQYREAPQDFTLPGGPVSYDTTSYDTTAAPPDPGYVGFGGPSGYGGQPQMPPPGMFPPDASQPAAGQQAAGQQAAGQHGASQQAAGQHGASQHGAGQQSGRASRPRPNLGGGAAKRLFTALSDTSFNSFVTPAIVSVVYKLAVVAFALVGLGLALFAFMASLLFGVLTLFIIAPAVFIVGVAFARVILEFCLVSFQMAGDLRAISGRDDA